MRQRRWLELLSDYDCELRYHPGKANVVADALSRKSRPKPLRKEENYGTEDCMACLRTGATCRWKVVFEEKKLDTTPLVTEEL
ncbi:hypothetical protein Tco_0364457 [Tanacetum coccineum]